MDYQSSNLFQRWRETTPHKGKKQTQSIFAERLGVSLDTVKAWERCKSDSEKRVVPNDDALRKMREIYGLKFAHEYLEEYCPFGSLLPPVEQRSLLQAVVNFKHVMKDCFEDADLCELLALDDKITEDELPRWLTISRKQDAVVAARYEIKFAIGADK